MTLSNRNPGAEICGFGAATPVGTSALASAAAVRAGLTGFAEHPFMFDSQGEPMTVAQCTWLSEELSVDRRIGRCLITAVAECLEPLHLAAVGDNAVGLTLLVNLPSTRPGLTESLEESVQLQIDNAFPRFFSHFSFAQLGHAGSLVDLQTTLQILAERPDSACIVAGADSYFDPDTLEWLEQTGQLHGAGPRNNAWGFVPGEGAGALLLSSATLAKRLDLRSFGQLTGIGLGNETNLIRTRSVCLGEGLTAAFQAAFSALPATAQVTDVHCDMNGQPYRADEFAFAVTRTRERFLAPADFVAPADCWGDVGAASATLLVVLDCLARLKGYSHGLSGLVWASSETGQRGAALLENARKP